MDTSAANAGLKYAVRHGRLSLYIRPVWLFCRGFYRILYSLARLFNLIPGFLNFRIDLLTGLFDALIDFIAGIP
jgi:hypothetical protein